MNSTDVEFDEFCDPNNPRKIKFEDIRAAARRIAGSVLKTSCPKAHMSDKLGVELYMKQEFLQFTGSFKERGVRNTLMNFSDEQKKIGAITASAGNHGMALSHHTTQMGIPGIVVLPIYTPLGKVSRCERLGAKVLLHGTCIADAKHYAMALSKEKHMPYINGFDNPYVIEGQGTVAIEILEQVPGVDAILLPVGGGSLLAGCAVAIKHLKPEVEVYGIETNNTASMTAALKKNERTYFTIESTIADGLAVNMVGVNTFHTIKGIVDKVIVVNEDWVARAVTLIAEHERYIVEGAGSVGVAAILAGLLPNLKGKKVVSVMSGGNIVPTVLTHVFERGLSGDGRLVRFKVIINDRTGGMAELSNAISSIGVIIRDIVPERVWVKGDIYSLEVKVVAETKGWDHTKELIEQIKKNFKECHFQDSTECNDKDVEFDEFCDPDNPRKIKYDDILAASKRIFGAIVKTPCPKAHMSERLGMELYMKQEFLQYTGSFKERGVKNTLLLLTEEQKKYGVITATCGNHGTALSYHATQLGIPCIVVMPVYVPLGKSHKCETLGAKVLLYGNNILEAKRHAMTIGRDKKMTYINGFDHPNIIEGQGTVGIEILEQVPNVDAVLVPVGGGSLLCGIAIAIKHLKPDTEVYGIETDKTCSMVESLRKTERIFLPIDTTIADALAVNMVGVNTFFNIKNGLVDKMIVVKEDWVARAIMHVCEVEKLVVEGAGCVCVAAIMANLFPNLKGKRVVCVFSGGNILPGILSRALDRGMAEEGRLYKFKVTVGDRPGAMSDLCALLGSIGVAMRDCLPARAWIKGNVNCVEMKIIAETRGWDQTKDMIDLIKKNYKEYYFPPINDGKEKTSGARRGPCLAPNPVCMQK